MANGFPFATGNVLSATNMNGLTSFTIGSANTTDYTAVLADQYQVLEIMNKATAIAFKIPTNASVAFPIGTVITVLNIGAGVCTILSSHLWHNHSPISRCGSSSSYACTI